MPRNTRYRKEFKAQNDLYWRFDIIPGDDTVFNFASASTTLLGDETVLSIGNIKLNYRDNLVFGLPEYDTLDVDFNFVELPADLKTYLSQTYKPGTETSEMIASNFCILWSSINNIDWEVVYVGIQTPQLTSEITVSYQSSTITKIKFQPLHTAVLARCKWNKMHLWFDDAALPELDSYVQDEVYAYFDWTDVSDPTEIFTDVGSPTGVRLSNQFGNTSPSDNFYIYPYKLEKVFELIRREMVAVFKYVTRQAAAINRTSATWDITTDYLSWEYDRYIGSSGVIKIHQAQNSLEDLHDRQGSMLSFTNIYIPLLVNSWSASDEALRYTKSDFVAASDPNQTAGGIFNSNDKGSLPAQFKTFAELFVGLSEWAISKMLIKYTYSSNKLKLVFEVFGALEDTNTSLTTSINFLEDSASEELKAEIGFICSSVETGNSTAMTELEAIPAQSPILADLAKSQTFTVKNCVFSWDVSIPAPNAENNFYPTKGNYSLFYAPFPDLGYRGWNYTNIGPIPCTTLFYSQGLVKVSEYVEIGDTTKLASPFTYYTTQSFNVNGFGDIVTTTPKRYLDVYKWMYNQHFNFGTATQINKCLSNILTNNKNWIMEDIEVYHLEQLDLGLPQNLLGHKIENGIPQAYDDLLELPNKGFITSVEYEIITGKYNLTTFQTGLLM